MDEPPAEHWLVRASCLLSTGQNQGCRAGGAVVVHGQASSPKGEADCVEVDDDRAGVAGAHRRVLTGAAIDFTESVPISALYCHCPKHHWSTADAEGDDA